MALIRDRVDPRTYKIREALVDYGLFVTEYVRTNAYHEMFAGYASSSQTRDYNFFYDGWGYDYLCRHLELLNAASYSGMSRRLRRDGYQVLHCNSVTEHLAAGLRRWGCVPVVTEVYDTTSMYEVNNIRAHFTRERRRMIGPRKWVCDHIVANALRWEKEANERGAGLVYTSRAMLEYVTRKYSVTCPSVVVPNAVYGKILPRTPAPEKLSAREGGIHLVYTGVIRDSQLGHHRDICNQLDLISRGEVVTHLYPIIPESEAPRVHSLLDDNRNIRWHEPADYNRLYQELRQYDGGLVLLAPFDTALLEVALPNKLFEYAAAGIPSLVSPYPPLLEFIKEFDCGQPLGELDALPNEFRPKHVTLRPEFTIEYYIPSLINLYHQVAQGA